VGKALQVWTFNLTRAVCGAHLGREQVAAAEVESQTDWTQGLDELLLEINRAAITARELVAKTLNAELLVGYRRS
jgi:hypothetical protein